MNDSPTDADVVCLFAGRDEPRVVRGRHDDGCTGDCRGCLPCPHAHCIVCGRVHVDQLVCPLCVSATRDHLHAIVTLCRGLRARTVDKARDAAPERDRILGGDAMVMIGPYGTSSDGGATRRGDAQPPLAVLASWEDDWRRAFGQAGGPRATIRTAAAYLDRWLPRAATELDTFDAFATEVRELRASLEAVLHAGDRDDSTATACFECGGQLVREVTDTGRVDEYTCRRCHRRYSDAEYWLAVKANLERQAEESTG
ncbi:hypothetical protein [Mumia sp. DW29H23]|uniref:hypothetical protein n=1 Tax=Mumia sp. DW29H23 TaxID=3421241 RepID=UPI003D687969